MEAMSDNWRPFLPRGVRLRHDEIRERHILLAPERIFEIDHVGVEILKRCDGRTFAALLADLALAFEATPEQIRGDVEIFLKGFADKRVLELGT
jgi:pyrroloquinoline quinone biosynthesis protein D